MGEQTAYLLGVNEAEYERLRFQHHVWKGVTDVFFDRIKIESGWNCLDVGAGPGFVTFDLRERIGDEGAITALEPSEYFLQSIREEVNNRGWNNIHCVQETVENATLPSEQFDFIFVRWVIAFVNNPEAFFLKLFSALKRGGVIAFQDYYYEGISLFPRGGAWDSMPKTVRAYYNSVGGDPYIAGILPMYFRQNKVRLIDFKPTLLVGGPASEVMEWAHRFFITHTQLMADRHIISQEQCDAFLNDWDAHRNNPDSLFFSPIVVDVAGRKE